MEYIGDVVSFMFESLAILAGNFSWKIFNRQVQQRFFAWYINRNVPGNNEGLHEFKSELFEYVRHRMEPKDRVYRLLEIGCGSVANIDYYPDGQCKLTCLDPNPHFSKYISQTVQGFETVTSVDVVIGVTEAMPLDTGQFDVVVSTMTLCCVTNVEKALAEIKRVLKPGGQFVFIEHVAAGRNTWTWIFQTLVNPFHKRLMDSCNLRRQTGTYIQRAGFETCKMELIYPKCVPFWNRPCILGTCTK